MKIKFLFLPIIILLVACCKDKDKDKPCNENGLPCLTTEGKNTFGCMVDGSPFVADVKFTVGGPVAVSGSYDETTNYLLIQGKRDNESGSIVRVNFKASITNFSGNNIMDVNTDSYVGYTDYSGQNCEYFHDLNNKGTVGITYLNIEKNIISGTFSMTLINPDCTKSTMVITEGRFDFGY